MSPLFQAAIHTAARAAQRKRLANPARRNGGLTLAMFYGLLLALTLLIAWLAKSFLAS